MKFLSSIYLSGLLFGLGLALSEMIDPVRVIGFLDITGAWDPTLLFVMGGALAVTLPAFPLVLKRPMPLYSEKFVLPSKKDVDWQLIAGSILFGAGWGLAGFCPGPAIAALVSASPGVFIFVIAMVAGQYLAIILLEKKSRV